MVPIIQIELYCATLLKKYRPTATFDKNHYSK